MGEVGLASVIVVQSSASDADLVNAARDCEVAVRVAGSVQQLFAMVAKSPPDAVLLELEHDNILAVVAARLPPSIRLIAIGTRSRASAACSPVAADRPARQRRRSKPPITIRDRSRSRRSHHRACSSIGPTSRRCAASSRPRHRSISRSWCTSC
jgi:hypothetical protein